MSYMALYRKWRPDDFQEVKGQEHIVTTLKNQIKYDRLGHAYLFCGTRGTGKTTVAKLLAKAVNCDNPIDGSPCNECPSCRAISNGTSMNVIEIDAASNNGVDNIRQINSAVQYSPQGGKYLVYIIDEVHMLSIGAFNALLKTLEEPPEYVKFILATTESHKIPITILSRCQRYDFRRISIETITARLEDLLDKEKIKATHEGVSYIARAADGSMRDALSILDQCIAFNLGEELTYDRVLETIGAVDIEVYIKLLGAIRDDNTPEAVDIIDKAVWQGKDLAQLVIEFTGFIRNVLMLKLDTDALVDVTSANADRLIDIGKSFTEGQLINYINILQDAGNKINQAATKRIALEVAVIKMCKPEMQQGTAALEERIKKLEEQLEKGELRGNVKENVVYVDSRKKSGDEEEMISEDTSQRLEGAVRENYRAAYPPAQYDEIMDVVSGWNHIKEVSIPLTRYFLDRVSVRAGKSESTIELIIINKKENQSVKDYFENPHSIMALEKQLNEMTHRDIKIVVRGISRREAEETRLEQWDLSKINFKIDYK